MDSRQTSRDEKESFEGQIKEPGTVRNMIESVEETYDRVNEVITINNPGTYTEYAASITKQTSDTIGDYNRTTAETTAFAARRSTDTAETDRKALQAVGINEISEEEVDDVAKQRGTSECKPASERGVATRKNINGEMGTIKEAVEDKLTNATSIMQEGRASREPKRARSIVVEKLFDDVKEGPFGPAPMASVFTSD